MFSKISTVGAVALFSLTSPALADWSNNVLTFGHSAPGVIGEVQCPAGGTPGSIWGTGTYTSDSSICGAAQHYGWIPPGGGGTVTYQTVPGLQAYQGSTQNGVSTSDYGPWDLAFQITGVSAGGDGLQTIAWGSSSDSLGIASDVGQVYAYLCPPFSGENANVWGSGIYSSDSSICAAARHAGRLNPQSGGPIRVLVLGEQVSFTGSQGNGVNSSSYGAWPRSYTFQ
jgi:hypothetical protein